MQNQNNPQATDLTPVSAPSQKWFADPLAVELLGMLKRWPPVASKKIAPSDTSLRGRVNYTRYSGPIVAALSDLHEQHFQDVQKLWETDPANAKSIVSAFLSQPSVQDVVARFADNELASADVDDIAAVLECVA